MTALLRIGGTAIALVLAALILALGLSGHFARETDPQSATRALTWNPRQPDALVRQARELAETTPAEARTLLEQAVRARPVSADPLLLLASIEDKAGNAERADALVEQATALEPASPRVLIAAAGHWVQRNQLPRALSLWSAALTADVAERERLFPVLLAIAENIETRALLRGLALAPPPWWDLFFREVARRALDVETVRALYAMRREATDAPFSADERRDYLTRLKRDGLVTEAYLVWINGLTEDERRQLGLLYNGGFELEPTSTGFDWHIGRPRSALITTAATFGVEGERALQVVFQDMKTGFGHVYQPLFLDPAVYRFSGRVRADSYQSLGGLAWRAFCIASDRIVAGESERFLGTSEWRDFSFDFPVSPGCLAQEVRLQSAQHRPGEKMKGAVWFDSLSIRRIGDLPPLAEVTDETAGEVTPPAERTGEPAGDEPPMAPPDEATTDPPNPESGTP